MRRKKATRIVAMLLACIMLMSMMTGCGSKKTNGNDEKATKVTFPLEEQVTFSFMIEGTETADFKDKISNNALWKKLEKETNVHIDFVFLGDTPAEKLSLLVNSNSYGDVLMGGPIIGSSEASKYMAAGLFADLTDYISEEFMPNLYADIQEDKQIMSSITSYDGKVYTLPKITGIEGSFLESPIWINKAWLDKLGLAIPTTLDEFTNCLRAFATKDPNGNGLPDEIPYLCATSSDSMHLEALMGIFGIATKDGTNDSYVQVIDGKVNYVPTMPAYKDAINYLASLYKEGLIWQECFTANASALNAKLTSQTPVAGCYTSVRPASTPYEDDYVCILPPKAEGYETCWYYHYAVHGSKNQFFVMNTCENLSVLMAWMDKFYEFENALAFDYGFADEGRYEIGADGKVTIYDLDDDAIEKAEKENPTLSHILGNYVRSITASDYQNYVNPYEDKITADNCYNLYKDVLNTELWPRPYFSVDDAYNADLYMTDIDYQTTLYRASWITGKSDVNQEFDSFVKKLESLHLNEYIEILQKSYDAAMANVK